MAVLLSVFCGTAIGGYKAGRAALERGDYKRALRQLTAAAEEGDGRAQKLLGDMYFRARGVARDRATAAEWYRRAAANEIADAAYDLGKMLADGDGVPRDDSEAAKWFAAAGLRGHVDSMHEYAEALLAGRGVERSESEAARWFLEAAEEKHAPSQYEIGCLLAEGKGVEPDAGRAAVWFRKAADAGEIDAQLRLAELHAAGLGVEKDLVRSRRLLSRPAAWQRPGAEARIDSVEAALSPERIERLSDLGDEAYARGDYVTAAYEWHRRAVRGDAHSRYQLAGFYARGYGVVQDPLEAYVWAKLAARQSHERAARLAESLEEALDAETLRWAEYRVEHGDPTPWDPRQIGDGEIFDPDERGVTQPVLIRESRTPPEYPEQARVNRASGSVRLEAVVLADGRVSHLRVLSCDRPNLGFEQSALAAARTWRYEPAMRNGQPVAVFFEITVDYEIG